MSPRIRPRLVLAALGALALATGTQLATAGAAGASQAHAGASQTPAVSRACPVDLTPGHESCMVLKRTDVTPQVQPASAPKGIPAGYGYGPAQLQAAYNLAAAATADGKNSTVAVVDAYDDPTAASDLAVYRTAAGLPAANLTKVNQNGKASPLPKEAPADDDWTLEESLDLDMVSAICPNCKIILVEANNDSGTGLYSYDLEGRDEEDEDREAAVSKEMAAFANFRRNWKGRDGTFCVQLAEFFQDRRGHSGPPIGAHREPQAGRAASTCTNQVLSRSGGRGRRGGCAHNPVSDPRPQDWVI